MGTRGIPAAHGGFETVAQQLAGYLTARGWHVGVYCQEENGVSSDIFSETWQGIERIVVPSSSGEIGSLLFDFKSIRDALGRPGVILVLGYNTGLFTLIPRMYGRSVVINMDGIEWMRSKWNPIIKLWFWLNEHFAANFGTALIADHPEIAAHLSRNISASKITVIPYGADEILSSDETPLAEFGLSPNNYYISVCRIEPENSIVEIVRAFAAKRRKHKLLVLGLMEAGHAYHDLIRASASADVIFAGPIYEKERLSALRFHARAYCHGHTVGGTSPSLVEALGAGNAVLAKDNRFNRWTAGDRQFFFSTVQGCAAIFDRLEVDDESIAEARVAARARFKESFLLEPVLANYESLLSAQTADGVKRGANDRTYSVKSVSK